MENGDKVRAIMSWQKSDMHPLTCGKCSENLYPVVSKDKEIVLGCDCGYVQENIPKIVFERYLRLLGNK